MRCVLQLVETGRDGKVRCTDVMELVRPDDLRAISDLGLTLAEGKELQARVQQEVAAVQAMSHATMRPDCQACGGLCHVKDYRDHRIATLFGEVLVRLPRLRCATCGVVDPGIRWPSNCRSTPELDELRAQFSALMTYRVAAETLGQVFPIDTGKCHETFRQHTLKLGAQLLDRPVILASTAAMAIALSVDGTFIRSCEEGERHFEVRVGNVETEAGGRQVFGAVAKAGTDFVAQIGQKLKAVGCTDDTEVTGFTDGCEGLRSVLVAAGVTKLPILDWFHIAMRLHHLEQIAGSLSVDTPERVVAKAGIVEEVECLKWRLWNGKAKDAQISIKRIRAVMHHFQGEKGERKSGAPASKLWTALQALDGYLTGQSDWMVNYAERHRAGLRVGTAITEGTANFLVNRRMNKSQQMRWTRLGADRLLQVRCAVYNGTIGAGLGARFDPDPRRTEAAMAA
jgi:hypothetical protein